MEKDLEKLTVTKLREEAKKYPGMAGVHAMKKVELIEAIKNASGEPKKEEKKSDEKFADKKVDLKGEIRALILQREKALENKDRRALKSIRIRIKRLKRRTRRLEK